MSIANKWEERRKNKLSAVLSILLLFLSLSLVFSQTLQIANASTNQKAAASRVVVTAPDLNVRESGGNTSKIIDVVHKGETFTVIQTVNHWTEVKLANQQTGWLYSGYVKKIASKVETEATVHAPALNIRQEPDLSSDVIGQLPSGAKIQVLKEQGGWANIVTTSKVSGWVDKSYLTQQQTSSSQEADHEHSSTQTRSGLTKSNEQAQQTESKHPNPTPLKGKVIVLDPGHGGKDAGTTSRFTGTHEKTLNLATAATVEQRLEGAGALVIMTRTTDIFIPLEDRAAVSNENHADAFISFHYNWSNDPSAKGISDFYYQASRDHLLAANVINEVAKSTGLEDNGSGWNNLSVLRNNTQPSILLELGFLSNQTDNATAESSGFPDQVAQGVYQGLFNYFQTID
ncbi:N-acetylmuramoyl-L-alanine amidase [Halobacillus rhizosphaerae]|uniref:N-acetylmuramoyl-L-alanine amidase n=1 Tax=Halobacillus rhizosphaerae TaxID=3064889 RepID=UPI00398A99DF